MPYHYNGPLLPPRAQINNILKGCAVILYSRGYSMLRRYSYHTSFAAAAIVMFIWWCGSWFGVLAFSLLPKLIAVKTAVRIRLNIDASSKLLGGGGCNRIEHAVVASIDSHCRYNDAREV